MKRNVEKKDWNSNAIEISWKTTMKYRLTISILNISLCDSQIIESFSSV